MFTPTAALLSSIAPALYKAAMGGAFPEPWPDDCPCAGAEDANGIVFRLVTADPPAPDDLKTHAETGKLPKADPCLRAGLSVFRTLEDVLHQAELFPFLGDFVAKATLLPEHGQTKLTKGRQPTHTTWWVYVGVDRSALFGVDQKVQR